MLQRDDLSIWVEQTFGLREDEEGNLVRQSPARLQDASAQLAALTGADVADCTTALRDTLLSGSRARDAEVRSLFPFKLHQFIGKGDTAYVTLDRPGIRYITTQYQRSAPVGPAGQSHFPLAFCRECGQDYLVVNREQGGERFTPRVLNGGLGEPADRRGGTAARSVSVLPVEEHWFRRPVLLRPSNSKSFAQESFVQPGQPAGSVPAR
ncbi:hypothetical protein SAMN05661093_09619 [Kibdelosporangium aridum]|uniref:Uncharacterized protein n=1 Tax=Kibdelosporangium aridum TaxID=2030 RepID=A0A1W2FVX0_KIBAR|nr:hypothetical protein SAMN05661093_09619 [Kibdelosporangium aridum]